MENKSCPECGKAILGRQDKKYCSDLCRHSYNNRQRSEQDVFIKAINNILRRNRCILADLIPADSAKVSRNKLSDRGFNFNYITSFHLTKKGPTYFFCYDYGYRPLENGYFFLVKKKE